MPADGSQFSSSGSLIEMKEKGVTTITLKKINREKVYQYIYREKQTSKLQIVQDLQMDLRSLMVRSCIIQR